MPASLLNTAIALPRYSYSQEEFSEFIAFWLAEDPVKAAKASKILAHAEVDRRYIVRPAEWYPTHTSVTERSAVYREEMVALCESAATSVLDMAEVCPRSIGLIITTSCTGFMIPAVDSHLLNRIPFRSTIRRMPLTELGCAGGAAAVAHADHFLRAYPDSAALIVAAELCSLTAQVTDFSMANIVSGSLFGDGAAATLVTGEKFLFPEPETPVESGKAPLGIRIPEQRPVARILATRSVQFPDSLDMMGFDNTDGGFRIVMSPQLPRFARQRLPGVVGHFLEEQGLAMEDLSHFLLHPGGPKVIDGLEQVFKLSREHTRISRKVMRKYGNLSSATLLFVLHHFEREGRPQPGDYGLMMALGPGFCAEMALLQW